MIPAPLRYVRASSLDEALDALAEPDSKALAGGQSLLPLMKLRLARPSLLVDIGRLELTRIESANGELVLGALTVWDELARAPELRRPALSALSESAARIGDFQVRNRGTVGGGLAHADPASDMAPVMLALGASLSVRSKEGERTLAATSFFLGPFTNSLRPQELITSVLVPVPPRGSGSAYVAVEHPASGFPLVGAAAVVRPDGHRVVALTGAGATSFVLSEDEDPMDAVADAELFGDRFAPVEYRRSIAAVVVRRALERAQSRAREDDGS
jgi:carbon-monoxide dehydrogenase medium subunit